MAAYFARRLVGGMAKLFLIGLALYSLVIYTYARDLTRHPDFVECRSCTNADAALERALDQQLLREWGLDKPWPISYVAWLFDPTRTTKVEAGYKDGILQGPKIIPYGIDINLFGLHLQGSGLLVTGNLRSTEIMHGELVTDILGPELGEFMLLLPLTLFAAMALVLVQRRRRPRIYGLSRGPHVSVLVDEYKQHLVFLRL